MDVIVVGGGPSGMMAAISAAKDKKVMLLEKNDELGKKLKVTGGGRCNITNNREIDEFFDKVVTNKKFLYSSFYTFTNNDLLNFFKERGLEYKVEDFNDNKVYTKSDKSTEVIDILRDELKKRNVEVKYNSEVCDLIIENSKVIGVVLLNGEKLFAKNVIISTGGASYPHTGSDGKMYEILKKYNHTITPIYPALSPLIIKEDFIKNLQGISIKNVEISFKIKKKKISNIGDMIFTHFGISGPCVLITSSFLNKILKDSNIEINIDFLPNTTKEELSNILRLNKNKNVLNNLKEKSLLPSNFVTEIFKLLNIVDVKASDLTNLDEQEIIKYIKNMTLTVTDIKGLKSAMVTSGGVSVKEINSSNLKSKIIENLYFTGEVIDVDAQTGGYNLQIAFSTGYLAGRSI